MFRDLVIARPAINNAILDEVVHAASNAKVLIGQLSRVSAELVERLLSDDVVAARLAASELLYIYFGKTVIE